MPTVAQAIDGAVGIIIADDDSKARMLADLYDGLPGSVSKEEYYEFCKRNLETQTKMILEELKEALR